MIRWHRRGFRYYWKWKSRPKLPGRPRVTREVRDLIRQMSRANPLCGAPHIHGELLKLGIDISQASVSKYMVKPDRPSSQSWRTFLVNHASETIPIDFFMVPTVSFRVISVFLILDNARRKVLHFNVTVSPNAIWAGHQIAEAFPWDTAPRFLIILNERHLRHVLRESLEYYNRSRTHLGLEKDCPVSRPAEPAELGEIQAEPVLGGLHHRYYRRAA